MLYRLESYIFLRKTPVYMSWFERYVPAKEDTNLPWNAKCDPLPCTL